MHTCPASVRLNMHEGIARKAIVSLSATSVNSSVRFDVHQHKQDYLINNVSETGYAKEQVCFVGLPSP